jgi:hypothetical protein
MKGSRTKYSSGFDPKTIPGCSLWLDGADPTGTGSRPSIGTSVSTWVDKSGSGRNGISEGTSIPTFSNRGITYDGSGFYRTSYSAALPAETLFVVFRWASIGNNGPAFIGGTQFYQRLLYVDPASSRWIYFGGIASWGRWNTSPLSSNVDYMLGVTWNSSSVTLHLNGSPLSTAGSVGNIATFSGSPTDSLVGGGFNGTMYEMIGYTTVLTTAQRQQVEGYLARKWGLTQANLLTSPHPYQTLAPAGFLPTSIPGCALWLDAADASTLTLSGSTVTAWADKSGGSIAVGVSGTPTWSSNAVRFTGSQYFSNASLSLPMSNMTVFLVGYNTSGYGGGLLSLVPIATGVDWNQSNAITYNFSTNPGELYTTFNFNATSFNVNRTFASSPLLFTHVQNGTATTLFAYGSNYSTGTLSMGTTTGFSIGARFQGGNGTANAFLTGQVNEVLLFSNALTTAQRQQVEGYLAWKWGPRTTSIAIPATHPYATFPPTLRPFGPTDVSGCILWLDAADRKTLFQDSGGTQPITAVGQSIGLWRDKSSRGYLMTVPSGKSAPTYGQNVINTTGTNALWSTTNFELTGNAKLTLFFVFASSVAPGYDSSCSVTIGNPNAPVDGKIIGLGIGVQGLPTEYVYNVPLTFSSAGHGSVQPRLVGVTTLTMAKYDGTTVFGNYNGASLAPSGALASGGANWSALPFQTGSRSANAGGSADGFMCEVLCYNDALSTLQIQQIEGYLARKWGLNSSVAVGHPYRFGLPPLTAGFTPRALTGCTLWLDAADRSTLTLSGSTITQWRDKSGNGYAGTPVGSPLQTTINGLPAVAFNGSQYFDFGDVADLGSANLNIFVVSRFNTTGDGSLLAKSLLGESQSRYSLLRTGGSLVILLQADGATGQPTVSDTNTAFRLLSWTWDRTTQTLYQNGTSILSSGFTSATTFNSAHKLLIGAYNDGAGGTPPYSPLNLNGTIGEILFVFGTLTTIQRQEVEGYLAWKWGLQDSLPGGHPFRMLKP